MKYLFNILLILIFVSCKPKTKIVIGGNEIMNEDNGCARKVYFQFFKDGEKLNEFIGLPYHRSTLEKSDTIRITDIYQDSINVDYIINYGKRVIALNRNKKIINIDTLIFVDVFNFGVKSESGYKNYSVEKYRFSDGFHRRMIFYNHEIGVLNDWNDGSEFTLVNYCSNPQEKELIFTLNDFCKRVAMDSLDVYKGKIPDDIAKPLLEKE
jgi:hypothetical protein